MEEYPNTKRHKKTKRGTREVIADASRTSDNKKRSNVRSDVSGRTHQAHASVHHAFQESQLKSTTPLATKETKQ